MAERAGSTVTAFILDVSRSMGSLVADPSYATEDEGGNGEQVQKLAWAKEYVTRKLVALIQAQRKTEHVCAILVGGKTNNSHASLGYPHIEVLFEPQTASTWMVDKIQGVQLGSKAGDVFGALAILLPLLTNHSGATKPSWSYNVSVLTDGENSLYDEDFDQIVRNFGKLDEKHNLPTQIQVAGFGFADKTWDREGRLIEEDKSEIKIATEALFRRLKKAREESGAPKSATVVGNIYRAVLAARAPQLKEVKPTLKSMSLRIGDRSVDPKEAIEISVKIGKMTSLVRPQSSKKVAVRTDGPSAEASGSRPRQSESQQRSGMRVVGPDGEELGHVGGGDDSTQRPPPPSSFASTTKPPGGYGDVGASQSSQFNYPQSQSQYQQAQSSDYRINTQPYYLDRNQPEVISNALKPVTTYNVLVGADENGDGGEVQAIEKEKLTKAWKFGSSWLPIDDEDGLVADKFETEMGLDLYKFVKAKDFDREFEMGEVRYVFPDPSSTKAQVQLSSLVQAMVAHPKGEHYAIFRFCYSTNADPHLCVARAVIIERQQYLQFVQLPFADDYRRVFFNSLENVRNHTGERISVHSTIPTDEQKEAIGNLVDAMDMSTTGVDGGPFFEPEDSYNPAVHRIKDAMYHQFTARVGEPLFPIHPDLVKFFDVPEELRERANEVGKETADVLEVKKVAPRVNKKRAAEAMQEEDLGGVDDLLAGARRSSVSSISTPPPPRTGATPNTKKAPFKSSSKSSPLSNKPAPPAAKKPRTSEPDPDATMEADDEDATEDEKPTVDEEDDSATEDEEEENMIADPIGDYKRTLAHAGGDDSVLASKNLQEAVELLVRKGEQKKALDCLQVLRSNSIELEEALNYNVFISRLKKSALHASSARTRSFWPFFVEKGGRRLGLVTSQEDKYDESNVEDEQADQTTIQLLLSPSWVCATADTPELILCPPSQPDMAYMYQRPSALDIRKEIKIDHDNVAELFGRFKSAASHFANLADVERATPIVNTIVREISVSCHCEELTLHRAYVEHGMTNEMEKDRDDHAKLDKLLARVDTLKPEEPDYAKLVIEAVNAFIVHAYEQELALPILTAQLTEGENTALTREFLRARKIVSNRPHPGTPHTSGGIFQRFLMEAEKLRDHVSERIKGSRAYVDLSREHTWMIR